jgi:hypothetical protein
MRILKKLPALSFLLLISGYTVFGWLLAIHRADWRIWLISGAIAFGIEWIVAVIWAIAAVVLVFSKSAAIALTIGICVIWALLMFVARNEVKSLCTTRWQSFVVLAIVAVIGMCLGWFTDASLLPRLGQSIFINRP